VVEAYIGEYASGKSEIAVNRALELVRAGRQVTLVDLDLVEPCYTLRALKKELEQTGMTVLAWETAELIGLGETGNLMKPSTRFCLLRPGDVIMDIGYGISGARVLNLVENAWEDPDLQIYAVINVARPMTATARQIVDHVRDIGRVDGLINNSHLGDETGVAIVEEGACTLAAASRILDIPVVATVVAENLAAAFGSNGSPGHPVRVIRRYMPGAFW
jgi:NAD(P)-dependent dehydrogenase (short-subunit alcohol dehydrogenase family)